MAGFFLKRKRSNTACMQEVPQPEDQDATNGLEVLSGEIEIFEFDGPEIFNENRGCAGLVPKFEAWFEDFLEHKMARNLL
jgi:hypothetical protein